MSIRIKSYYIRHYLEQLDFRYRLYVLNKQENLEKRICAAQNLMCRVFKRGLGIYSCPDLERPFLELAKTLPVSLKTDYTPNSYLHVMTQAYLVGGHTRVVERWIDTSPVTEKHSVVLLNQEKETYPAKLVDICNTHNGELYLFYDANLIDRAKRLRDLASQYQYVILHIHIDASRFTFHKCNLLFFVYLLCVTTFFQKTLNFFQDLLQKLTKRNK